MTPKVVAEIGQCAEGDLDLAIRLVEECAEAGCWGVKVQVLEPDQIAHPTAQKYWEHGDDRTQAEVFDDNGSLTLEELTVLGDIVRIELGMTYIATPFDDDSVEVCVHAGVQMLKIASGDITNIPLMRAVNATRLPVILSTGAASFPEICAAVHELEHVDTLLACSLQYPTVDAAVTGFWRMEALAEAFGLPVGYSDHTLGTWSAPILTALGATMIEKHVTHSEVATTEVPDHEMALRFPELCEFVSLADEADAAIDASSAEMTYHGEEAARHGARRSLWWSADLPVGTVITAEDVSVLRPGPIDGRIGAADWDDVVGARVTRRVVAGSGVMPSEVARTV